MSNDKNDVIFKQLTAQIEEYNSNLKKEISKSKKRRNIINAVMRNMDLTNLAETMKFYVCLMLKCVIS